MRLNKYIALHTEYSRRGADEIIKNQRVRVNDSLARQGQEVTETDQVCIDEKLIKPKDENHSSTVIILNKPSGYVCSRDGQGSPTVYDLLPEGLRHLNYAGRLDKDSSGLLVMTDDGDLANRLTHPRYEKIKIYEVNLSKPLRPLHQQMIADYGIKLEDGLSKFQIDKRESSKDLLITMKEGRNRQIRRTFNSLGYEVTKLHRIQFGSYQLQELKQGDFQVAE